jgi:hypothetical protein
MLNWSAIYAVVEKKDKNGIPVEFSMSFVKRSTGDIVDITRCVCTSSHFRPRTINIKCLPSEEIRKVRCCCITKINDSEIYI